MMVVLALASALLYGTADFGGALATRRTSAVAVVFWSQFVGAGVLLALLPLLPGRPAAADLGWGLAAGFAGAAGMVLLYRGLAAGPMSVVSPVTAVCAAAVPVLGGLALGETFDAVAVLGVAVGLGAVTLLSVVPAEVPVSTRPLPRGLAVLAAAGAGSAFGVFFLALDRTASDAGLWPLLGARTTSLSTLLVTGLVGTGLRIERPLWRTVALVGLGDMAANATFLLATRQGAVGLVAVIVAFAPAGTVALARIVLHERIHRVQAVGMGAAALAVALIALS